MLSVEDIGKEETLFKKMPLHGYIEQRDKYLIDHGLYNEWEEIYTKYVNLACQGDLEALKRAIFFAWYHNYLSQLGCRELISCQMTKQKKLYIY